MLSYLFLDALKHTPKSEQFSPGVNLINASFIALQMTLFGTKNAEINHLLSKFFKHLFDKNARLKCHLRHFKCQNAFMKWASDFKWPTLLSLGQLGALILIHCQTEPDNSRL